MRRRLTARSLVLPALASILAFWLGDRAAALFALAAGLWPERLSAALNGLAGSISSRPFWLSADRSALLAGGTLALLVWLVWLYWLAGAKNYRPGEEHGSARWGTAADIKPLMNPESDLNIPLSATEQISLPDLPEFQANRNKNILLVGGSGSGKTYGVYYPSMMQLHSSYVITDPKGSL